LERAALSRTVFCSLHSSAYHYWWRLFSALFVSIVAGCGFSYLLCVAPEEVAVQFGSDVLGDDGRDLLPRGVLDT
jgi:hypothetical protein